MANPKETKSLREIACVLAETRDAKYILHFLHSLLTPNEIHEIASRWELVKLLDQGYSQRQIAQQLGLSLCKITRGSRELKRQDSPFKHMIEKLAKKSGRRPAAGKRKKSA